MTADLRREKLDLQRSQNNVLLYGCSCLSAIKEFIVVAFWGFLRFEGSTSFKTANCFVLSCTVTKELNRTAIRGLANGRYIGESLTVSL